MKSLKFCLLALGWFVASLSSLSAAEWKAGVAKAVITPETSVWLAGYGSKRVPDGKLHDLWMKALALEDAAGRRAVLVTSDFQGVPKGVSDRVFAALERKLSLKREQVMITFSHNHCGPRLGDDLVDYYPVEAEQVTLVDEYSRLMETKIVAMIGEAFDKLAPAKLEIGAGRATFGVNRRNNREAEVPQLLAKGATLAGPVDHAVPIITVTRPDGKLEAILFGYACHPTTLNFTKWCGDYPGFAQLELEKAHPGTTAMFVNTCGGDQNPLPRRSIELCERYGHLLAVGVEEALKQPLRPIQPELHTAFEYVDLPYLKVVSREDLHAMLNDAHPIRARWAARMLQKLDGGEKFPAAYPYPIHAWRLGDDQIIVGMGAETVVDYALRFKREFGPNALVFGYVDDMISYIPSRRVWEEGGYEGGSNLFEYGRPALRWAGDIEDRIAATVGKLVRQVEGGEATSLLGSFGAEPVKIVCMGDSVTGVYYHTGGRRAYPEMLEVAIRKAVPKANVTVINAGISGNTTADGLARLDRDVLAHKPQIVTISFGLNDVVRVPPDAFRQNLVTLIERCRGAGAKVVLCTPNAIMPGSRSIPKVVEYCEIIRDVAKQQKTGLCDQFAAGESWRRSDAWAWRLSLSDAIHPNMAGHKRMAEELCRVITGRWASLDNEPPLRPALVKTLARIEAGQPVRVLAMPPYDALIGPALKSINPKAEVSVTPWPVAGKPLAEIEKTAKDTVRQQKPDLVLLAVPRNAAVENDEAFAARFSWIMNWSLSFGHAEWDCLVVHPAVTEPSVAGPRDDLMRRLVRSQDLHLVDRAAGVTAPAEEIFKQALKMLAAP
jgi:lysophospholipase L1-like esterase